MHGGQPGRRDLDALLDGLPQLRQSIPNAHCQLPQRHKLLLLRRLARLLLLLLQLLLQARRCCQGGGHSAQH
jgi:hypothetical protein